LLPLDQTFLSGVNRIKLHMGSDAATFLKGRCQIIKYVACQIFKLIGLAEPFSVWRPLFEPLEDYPLALCDYRSINVTADCVASDLLFPHYIGEQYHMMYSPHHQWYYLNKQRTNEMILLKCYESVEDGAARCMCINLTCYSY
jgi:hypothetical protein